MTLVSPAGKLTSFGFDPIVSQLCASTITPLSEERYRIELVTCPDEFLVGTQQVAWLNFTAVADQPSAFVPVSFEELRGTMADGTPVANFAPQSGRVIVVGEEPLLEMSLEADGQPLLVLYGKPEPGYDLEWRTDLAVGAWQPVLTNLTVPTNLFLDFRPLPGDDPVNFYRANRAR
jgi:hypothetical protein